MQLARSLRKLKHLALGVLPAASPAWGRVLLSRARTIEVLKPFEVYSSTPAPVPLRNTGRIAGVTLVPFQEKPDRNDIANLNRL